MSCWDSLCGTASAETPTDHGNVSSPKGLLVLGRQHLRWHHCGCYGTDGTVIDSIRRRPRAGPAHQSRSNRSDRSRWLGSLDVEYVHLMVGASDTAVAMRRPQRKTCDPRVAPSPLAFDCRFHRRESSLALRTIRADRAYIRRRMHQRET